MRIAVLGAALCLFGHAETTRADDQKPDKAKKKKAKKKKAKKVNEADKAANAKIKRLKADRPFWSWLADPHGREIKVILSKVEENRQLARNMTMFSYQGAFLPETVLEKTRALDDAIGMLHYARKLDPDNAPVLSALAEVCESAGRTTDAIEAYEAFLALPDKGSGGGGQKHVQQHGRLGVLYARQGDWDKAAEHLETGISEGVYPYMVGTMSYALVEMERGNLDRAIDFLVNVPNADGSFIQLALAVAYDRNDEESKASTTLDVLRRSQTLSGSMSAPWGTDVLPFTPAADLHYFRALLYEGSGHLAEARAEWLAYVRADPKARYREKAQRHIADIDGLKDTRPANKPARLPLGVGGVLRPPRIP